MITLPCSACGKAFDAEEPVAPHPVCPDCAGAVEGSVRADVRVGLAAGATPEPAKAALAADEQPCPYCGERIKKGALVCRFCRAELGKPPEPHLAARAEPPVLPPPRRSKALVWILLGVFAFIGVFCVGGLVFVVLPLGFKEQCRSNLSELYSAVRSFERNRKDLPAQKGSAFWLAIAEAQGAQEALTCGAAMFADLGRNSWPYRGPAGAWEEIPDDGIIACDRVKSHKEGLTVLFKNGRVEFAPKDGELYQRALRETSD